MTTIAPSTTPSNTPSTIVTDLNGLFEIQQNYITGIPSTDVSLSETVHYIQDQLQTLNNVFNARSASAAHILDKQEETSNIINTEKGRLLQKKQGIDNALIGKQRAVALNDSYRLRQSQIIKIKVTMVITLAICILLVLLGRRYPMFPSILITLSILIVLLIGVGYSLFLYSVISSRSKLNYNQLDLGGPKVLTPEEERAGQLRARKAGNLLGTIKPEGCVGSDCCSEGTAWSETLLKCAPYTEGQNDDRQTSVTEETNNTTDAFTTMNSNGLVHSPSEYDKYGRV